MKRSLSRPPYPERRAFSPDPFDEILAVSVRHTEREKKAAIPRGRGVVA